MIQEIKYKRKLHDRLVSLEWQTLDIIFNQIFYTVKYGAFFYFLFLPKIPIGKYLIIFSLPFGYFISRTFISLSFDDEKFYFSSNKGKGIKVKVIASLIDFLVLCVITDVLGQEDWKNIVYLLLFNGCVAFFSFLVTASFVKRVKIEQKKIKVQQELADIEQTLNKSEHKLTLVEQQSALLKTDLAEKEKVLAKLNIDLEKLKCPYCGVMNETLKAKAGHIRACYKNPKNKTN